MNFVDKFDGALPGMEGHARGAVHVDTVSTYAPAGAIIVNDGQFLFTADFKRSGLDLVLSKDDQELVLHDYFKGEKRAALASPDGAHLTGDLVNALTGYTQYAQAGGAAEPAKVIGHVTKLSGSATAVRNGVSIVLNQGDNVLKGDVVQSGSDSTLGITFIDGTVFGLGPNAKMVLNEMIYDPNGSNNSSLLSLVQGTISFVAGATAKHGDMKVDTPVATMGIRGTAVLVEIDFDVQGTGGVPPAKFQVLVEPDGTTGSYILFDKTTLNPIATVDRAGTQTLVNGQGSVSFISSAQLSADAQKLISDVFALKFTDNTNPNTKLTTNFTDTVIPITTSFKLANGDAVTLTIFLLNFASNGPIQGDNIPNRGLNHIPGPPEVVTFDAAFTEQAGLTHSALADTVSNLIRWADLNPGDTPSATVSFTSFNYRNAQNSDLTSSLTAEQLASINAVQIPLLLQHTPGNRNIGSATWTYSLADGAFDFLAAGETLTLTYTARVDNNYAPSNETTFKTFTITITGTNDAPVVTSSAQAAGITEIAGATNSAVPDTVNGTLTFSDTDLTDTHTVTITGVATAGVTTGLAGEATVLSWLSLGALTDSTDGVTGSRNWTFSAADRTFDYLAAGETLTLTYTIQIDDHQGGVVTLPVTITIVGTDDRPVITSPAQAAAITEAGGVTGSQNPDTASGTVTFTDVDLSDTHDVTVAGVTGSGVTGGLPDQATILSWLSLGALADSTGGVTGSRGWTFSAADSNFDYLAAGETLTLTYLVQVDDHHGGVVTQPVTITITGSNDTPVITSAPQAAAITEAGGLTDSPKPDTASGAVTFADVDLSDTHAVTITGVTWSGVTSGLADQATVLSWLSLGTLTDSSNGATGSRAWTFSAADRNFDYLADGETLTLTYTIQVDDHHGGVVTQPVTITIAGSNDTPVITSVPQTAVITEIPDTTDSSNLDQASGALTFTDADRSDIHGVTVTGVAESGATAGLPDPATMVNWLSLGTLTDSTNGATGSFTWNFSAADKNFDYLAKGETLTLTYTVQLVDNHGGVVDQSIMITINGSNDAPTLADVSAGTLTDTADNDSFSPLGGTLHGQDVDETAILAYAALDADGDPVNVSIAGLYGSLTVNADGTYTYVPNAAAINALAAGAYHDTFTVQTIDDHGAIGQATLTVDVTGTDDAPVTTDDVAVISGNSGSIAGGLLGNDTDAEHDTLSVTGVGQGTATAGQFTVDGTYGELVVDQATGTYTYTLGVTAAQAAAVAALPQGGSGQELFTYTAFDGALGTYGHLTVTVNGVNDAPVFTGEDLAATYVAGGGAVALAGNITVSDVDSDHYTSGALTATVTSGGQQGDTLTIVGNDHISVDANNNVMFDADGVGGAAAISIGTLIDQLNSLTINLNDSADDAAVAALAQAIEFENTAASPTGGTRTVTFTLHDGGGTASGGHDSDFFTTTVDVNHPATFSGDITGEVYEDEHVVVPSGQTIANDVDSGTLTVQDVDPGQNSFRPVDPDDLIGTYGDFTFDANSGHWTYTLVHDRVDALAAGELRHDTLTVMSADGTTQDITIDVHGTNDAPVVIAKDVGATYQANGAAVALVDNVSVSDIDSADYAGGSLTALISAGGHDGDLLSIVGDQYISVSGTTIMFDADGDGNSANAIDIGTQSQGASSLTIGLNGAATNDALAHLIQAIHFQSTDGSPVDGQRTVEFALNDGDGTGHNGHDTGYIYTAVNVATPAGNQAPLISTDNLQILQEGETTTIGGVSVSDVDATPTESFSLNVATGAGDSSVTPQTGTGSLADISDTLTNGLTYAPGPSAPLTDKVAITVTDGFGATDTVNFIFNVMGTGPNVTLEGTDGKDVLLASGYTDTLTGGAGADQFVFMAGSGDDTITDFTPGTDKIDLFDHSPFTAGNADSFDAWINSSAVEQLATGTVIHLDAGDSILLANVNRSSLHINDFILHPGGGGT